MIPLAKVTLLPRHEQDERLCVSSFIFQNIEFIAGVTQEVNSQVAVMYMKDPNFIVEFTDADFKELPEELLIEMGEKLSVEPKAVKTALLPKKTVAKKAAEVPKKTVAAVKSTLTSSKPATETPVEETSEETSTDE